MILHNDIERFSMLIKFTAEHFKILPAFILLDNPFIATVISESEYGEGRFQRRNFTRQGIGLRIISRKTLILP